MARNRRAALRRLSVEQETFMLCGNMLTRAHRDESDEDGERRLFGTRAAAAAAWERHREELLVTYPTPGRRPFGWWRHERRCDVPPVELQPDLLRQLGELTADEEAALAVRAAMVPEHPDLSIDHPSTPANLETHDVDDATSGKACPETAQIEAVAGTAAEVSGDAATEQERAKEDEVRTRPDLLFVPWPLQGQRSETEGWE